jgi:integrase/recombinase XerD
MVKPYRHLRLPCEAAEEGAAGLSLAEVRDLREQRTAAAPEEAAEFETDVLAGFVLARASAGLPDGTIRGHVGHLEQVRAWFGRPLRDMEPVDPDAYFAGSA